MKLELLHSDQFQEVEAIYNEQCGVPPQINTALIAVIKDDNGRVIGCCALEAIPIIDKLWVDPDYRGSGFGKKLMEKLAPFATHGYYAFPANEYSENIVKSMGLTKLPYTLYVKEV